MFLVKVWTVQVGSGGKGLGYIESRLANIHGNAKSNNEIEYGDNGISDYIIIYCVIVDYDYKWEFIQETFRTIREDLWIWVEIEKENYSKRNHEEYSDLLNVSIRNKFNDLLRRYYFTLRN